MTGRMTLPLNREVLAAAWDFLTETEPFAKLNLPHSEEITFRVIRTKAHYADCGMEGGKPVVRVSEGKNGHVATLLATLSHEAIHVHQFRVGDSANHNALFHKLAKKVCRIHGYDLKAF